MALKHEAKDAVQRLQALLNKDAASRRARLRVDRFTVVSNDCWGAEVYKDLNLPFQTPFIGTFVVAPCYMRLLADFERIVTSPLSFTDRSRYPHVNELAARDGAFPIGLLDGGNVEIHFLHYQSEADARQKWEKRVPRIDHGRLFFKLSGDKDLFTDDDYRTFEQMPLRNKLGLSKTAHPDCPSTIRVPDWTMSGKEMYERTLPHFDIVRWLNHGCQSPA